MATPSIKRIGEFATVTSNLFSTILNPAATRNGNKVLRQRLRGSVMRNYYPESGIKIQSVSRAFPELQLLDEAEEIRKSDVEA